jgi:hypothetical protein
MRAKNTKDPTFKGKTMKRSLALAIAALVILASSAGSGTKPSDTRPPSVAGQFYPADPLKLKLAIQQYLQDSVAIPMEKPLALIVPHAGYVYSGQICADAYRQVMGRSYDVVVLLGVNHTTGNFSGISLGDYGSFRTPLGNSLVDEEIISALLAECTRFMQESIPSKFNFLLCKPFSRMPGLSPPSSIHRTEKCACASVRRWERF